MRRIEPRRRAEAPELRESKEPGEPAGPELEPESEPGVASAEAIRVSLSTIAIRGGLGGTLMGLANLVPGISGGTMLLAAGIYPAFVAAVADLTRLRLRPRALVLLAAVGGAAVAAILLLAGPVRTLVVEARWAMYSLFIGLTLGGVPLVWRLARRPSASLFAGAALGLAAMGAMALFPPGAGTEKGALLPLFAAGLSGAAAMILPGVSGGYLLLLLGQYLPILGAVDTLKRGLLGAGGPDPALLVEAGGVLAPVALGVAAGAVGVSNLLRWTLERFPLPTLGLLLGLLLGAVGGLWPFQEPVRPEVGSRIDGRVVTEESRAEIPREDWPLEAYAPSPQQAGGAVGLALLGLGATLAIDRLARARD